MKKLLLSAIASLSILSGNAIQFSEATDIDDLTLVYLGAHFHPKWDEATFEEYVVHKFPDGTKSWFFDGFLILDYCIYNDKMQAIDLGEFKGDPAQRSDWEKLLKVQIGADSGNGLHALDNVIGRFIPELGKPGHKHKVVMGVPVAKVESYKAWGNTGDGEDLDFSKVADRVKAMKWYIDLLLDTWNAQKFKNIELAGVYWVKESFSTPDDQAMVKQVNEYYHQKKLTTYWIPYYAAQGKDKIKEMGIDVAYLQPNYYFNLSTPISQLDSAIDIAWENDMYLEMEFNEKAVLATSKESPDEYRQKFIDYIDHFEEGGVFDSFPVAYYSNDLGVYEFKKSDNNYDQDLINRFATIINKRHIETGWDSAPRFTGISDITTDEADYRIAYAVDGGIFIDNHAGENVAVYSADGRAISLFGASEGHYGKIINCNPGIYVVRVGQRSIKIAVR